MAVPGYGHDKVSLQARLARLEGQVRGIADLPAGALSPGRFDARIRLSDALRRSG
jgi:hypothetical protein